MSLRNKVLALAGAASLVLGAAAVAATTASATTLTCTGVQNQAVPPFGCGGAQLAYVKKGTLDLAVLGGNYWNSEVGFKTDSVSDSTEDWTVFAVDGSTTDGPGGLGEYVAAYTPGGKFASFTQGGVTHANAVPSPGIFYTGTNVYCLSVENLYNGPKGALRWRAVLRTCNSNGAFYYGSNSQSPVVPAAGAKVTNTFPVAITVTVTAPAANSVGVSVNSGTAVVVPAGTSSKFTVPSGETIAWADPTPGAAAPSWSWSNVNNYVQRSRANAYQVWSPVTGSAGLELINESLSFNHPHGTNPNNTPFVLDDTAFGGSGTWALAYPENDGLNQQSSIIGCSEPITGLNTSYQLCP